MRTYLLLALPILCSCAAVDRDLKALAADPNVVRSVEGLVGVAGSYLDQAIDKAENNALRVLKVSNGVATDSHAATELRRVKDGLDALNPQVPMPITRFAHPE